MSDTRRLAVRFLFTCVGLFLSVGQIQAAAGDVTMNFYNVDGTAFANTVKVKVTVVSTANPNTTIVAEKEYVTGDLLNIPNQTGADKSVTFIFVRGGKTEMAGIFGNSLATQIIHVAIPAQ
ncbi:MAG: hypothetical protein K8T89_22310 [Planctomycetes bacterium]|nr:hypothetical protein [Planctomycetota bacterium]